MTHVGSILSDSIRALMADERASAAGRVRTLFLLCRSRC
jgi:hypothetical protein